MTATRELIAAALSAADELDFIYKHAPVEHSTRELREACARAMVQTIPKTCSDERPCIPCFTDNGPCEGPSARDPQPVGERCTDYHCPGDCGLEGSGYQHARQPVGEVPMPEPVGFIDRDDDNTWATLADNAYELSNLRIGSKVFAADQMRTYGDAREAAGYAAGGKDAERYRFLRGDGGPTSVRWPRWEVTHWTSNWNPVSGKELDAAIDAALRGEVKP